MRTALITTGTFLVGFQVPELGRIVSGKAGARIPTPINFMWAIGFALIAAGLCMAD